jgi:hypothetical protein
MNLFSLKKKKKKKEGVAGDRTGGLVQVEEHLPNKHEVLSSNHQNKIKQKTQC